MLEVGGAGAAPSSERAAAAASSGACVVVTCERSNHMLKEDVEVGVRPGQSKQEALIGCRRLGGCGCRWKYTMDQHAHAQVTQIRFQKVAGQLAVKHSSECCLVITAKLGCHRILEPVLGRPSKAKPQISLIWWAACFACVVRCFLNLLRPALLRHLDFLRCVPSQPPCQCSASSWSVLVYPWTNLSL